MIASDVSDFDLSTIDIVIGELSKVNGRVVGNAQIAESLRRIAFAVREYQRVSPAEERQAWDAFAANVHGTAPDKARHADKMLEERRERFGGTR